MGILEDQAVNVGVIVADDSITATDLNVALILTNEAAQAVIEKRTKEYFLLSDIAADWGTTSKVYKAAAPHFSQQPHNSTIKIGIQKPKGQFVEADGVSFAIVGGVVTITSASHGLETGQEVIITNSTVAGLDGTQTITETPTSGTFTFATGEGDDTGTLDYRLFGTGADDDADVSVASGIATVDSATNGLSIGQEITVSDSSISPLLNGVKTITSVPDADTFTFAAAGVADDTGTLDYHTGDADITAALNAIWDKDSNWFHLISIYKLTAEILELAAWVEAMPVIYGFTVEDIDIYDSNETADLLSTLEGFGYNNTYLMWYHRAGVDAVDGDITIADEIATFTLVNHGLRKNESLTVSGADKSALNGNQTVLEVVDLDNFKFAATGVLDGADGNNGAIDYFARYGFLETGVQSRQLGRPEGIGGSSWGYKNIIGFEATSDDILSPSQALVIAQADGGGKGGNFYKELAGQPVLQYGRMVSGRTIKSQAVAIWLKIRLQEAGLQVFIGTEQLIYTNASLATVANAFQVPLGQQLERGGITPYSDTLNWLIEYDRADQVPVEDKNNNIMRYNIKVRSGNEILSLAINIKVVT